MNIGKIQVIINKLQEINIQDLQNIDMQQVLQMVRKRIDILISIVVIVVALVIAIFMSKGSFKKNEVLDWEVQQLQEKVDVLNESERVTKEMKDLLEKFPTPLGIDELVNKLSEFAFARGIHIVSFSPDKEDNDEHIRVARILVNVETSDYEGLVLFMKDIEDSSFALRVEQWSGKMREVRLRDGENEIKKNIIEATIKIESVTLKN